MRNWLTMICLIAPAAAALAQRGAEAEPDPLYHVELIIYSLNEANRLEEDFRHGDEAVAPEIALYRLPHVELESVFGFPPPPAGPEADVAAEPPEAPLASAEPGSPDEADALELFELRAGARAPEILPDGFRLLSRDELELNDVRASLNRSRLYTVLGHAGWALSGVDDERSVPLDLKRLGLTNPSGTIRITLRRFLHAALELEYTDGGGTFWSRSTATPPASLQRAERYPLSREVNAIRSGELHFVDFPLFGVLIQIVPAPEPEDETGSADGSGPAG